jgi:prolyl oligopeptidase
VKAVLVPSVVALLAAAVATSKPPATEKEPVTDQYHGVSVTDDYRWLENWNDPKVKAWSDTQNVFARGYLSHLPGVSAIRERLTQIMTAKTISYGLLAHRKGHLFAIKREPPKQQPFLIVVPSSDAVDQARVVVDPNTIDAKGTTAIDWYVPSPDGKFVAVSLSRGGSEAGDVHIFKTSNGEEVYEVVPHVNGGTAGGDLAWAPDGSGFFYTRYPKKGERPDEDLDFFQQGYYHQLGTPPETDRYEFGKDLPRVAEIEFEMHDPSDTLLATVQKGDGGQFSLYLRSPSGHWKKLCGFDEHIVQAAFGPNDSLYLISREDAPNGKILRVPLSNPEIKRAKTIIPEGPDAIVSSFGKTPPTLVPMESRIYVLYQLGGPTELRVFDLDGKRLPNPEQLPVSTVGGLTRLEADNILFSDTSFVAPPAVYKFDSQSGHTYKTQMATPSPVDFSDVEVVRKVTTSKDGTQVPVNILYQKGLKRDGKNPALITGYGGFAISMTPTFNPTRKVLLEQGFVWAIANIRGGSEFGEAWHRGGNLTHKQNVFDDFAAALHYVIDEKYTSPNLLAIEGGSNGGLLMGATLTQHPHLMRVVVTHVGIYDMLRTELSSNGSFNITEYGTVKDPEQFKALHAYSPYHSVKDGQSYPAILFLTGANDPRVDPLQSRKMTARLQSANASDEPILLRTNANAGHGLDASLSDRIAEATDVDAFIFDRLGIPYRPVTKHVNNRSRSQSKR